MANDGEHKMQGAVLGAPCMVCMISGRKCLLRTKREGDGLTFTYSLPDSRPSWWLEGGKEKHMSKGQQVVLRRWWHTRPHALAACLVPTRDTA